MARALHRSVLSACRMFRQPSILRSQRTAGSTGRAAAWSQRAEGPVRAVLESFGTTQYRQCCNCSRGNREPRLTDAALGSKVRYPTELGLSSGNRCEVHRPVGFPSGSIISRESLFPSRNRSFFPKKPDDEGLPIQHVMLAKFTDISCECTLTVRHGTCCRQGHGIRPVQPKGHKVVAQF